MRTLADIERDIENAIAAAGAGCDPETLLRCGEEVLEHWVSAKGCEPTHDKREGFRLLALHRQGAQDDPSFNACRETCRELVYHYNLLTSPNVEVVDRSACLNMMALVANHLYLFVSGKMQVAGLGEFCCSSKSIRTEGRDDVIDLPEIKNA